MTGSLVLVGGGLANCLLALRLRAVRPELPLTLLEAGPCLGGNHTWSFHGTDVPATVGAWLGPLANHSWTHYDVRFPQRERRLEGRYYSLTSAHLHRVVMAGRKLAAGAEHVAEAIDQGREVETALDLRRVQGLHGGQVTLREGGGSAGDRPGSASFRSAASARFVSRRARNRAASVPKPAKAEPVRNPRTREPRARR